MTWTHFYITSDTIGMRSGGGEVTKQELQALREAFPCDEVKVFSDRDWQQPYPDIIEEVRKTRTPGICHFYAGGWTRAVLAAKEAGFKVTYTAAAHDIVLSKEEHEKLGVAYDYPHLTDPEKWVFYIEGYKQADLLICPSPHSEEVMRSFGCGKNIALIPHGVDAPPSSKIKPLPKQFRVGYLGACGPDKGLIYLLEAWESLCDEPWFDKAVLVFGGRTSQFLMDLVGKYGCGNIVFTGWLEDVRDFYNNISAYVQPSVTEGFGIEILEACAYERPVIATEGAGASGWGDLGVIRVRRRDPEAIAAAINYIRKDTENIIGKRERFAAVMSCSWENVRKGYSRYWQTCV